MKSHSESLVNFSRMYLLKGLLGYYPHKITNGPLEGLNNKIRP